MDLELKRLLHKVGLNPDSHGQVVDEVKAREDFERALRDVLLYGVGKYFIYPKSEEDVKIKQVGKDITVTMPLCTYNPLKEEEEPHAYCIKDGIRAVWEKENMGPVEIELTFPEMASRRRR